MRTNLVSYWDHTEQERAALSDAEMVALETLELMENGIIVPAEPTYEPIETVEIKKRTLHELLYNDSKYNRIDVKFEDITDAETVAEILRRGYTTGTHGYTDCDVATPVESITIAAIEVAEKDCVIHAKEALTENKSRKSRNSKLKTEYEKAITKRTEALNSMHSDRWSQREELARFKKMHETWLAYLETCDGNVNIAHRFLLKAYTSEDIEQMNLWMGTSVPTEIVEQDKEGTDAN